ncbi:MAG: DUF475 domain-containing protein [Candidatus Moraniibacteriota bacterium]|nr:MAG: DUF475 domain-containing protein [Candidatus Moranbacteria bacterium]
MKKITEIPFFGSFLFLFFGLIAGYFIDGFRGVWIVALLSVLEISLSIDNAVVNAKILENWNQKWQRIFLIFGLPIAVFGMRLLFPILIVALATGMGSFAVLDLALENPEGYAHLLEGVHHQVAAFGGMFLLMVFFHFFIDTRKNNHWIEKLEKPLTKLGQIQAVEAALALLILITVSGMLDTKESIECLTAGLWGLITYIFSKGIGSILGGSKGENTSPIIRQGIAGFLYLEILDASFSFDGVLGAFALSNNLFIIAIGLGVGAIFVRSLTITLVEKKTLTTYRYLEHGAFWAIGALAILMLLGVVQEIPEAVTGLIGAILIGASFFHSLQEKKKFSSVQSKK